MQRMLMPISGYFRSRFEGVHRCCNTQSLQLRRERERERSNANITSTTKKNIGRVSYPPTSHHEATDIHRLVLSNEEPLLDVNSASHLCGFVVMLHFASIFDCQSYILFEHLVIQHRSELYILSFPLALWLFIANYCLQWVLMSHLCYDLHTPCRPLFTIM